MGLIVPTSLGQRQVLRSGLRLSTTLRGEDTAFHLLSLRGFVKKGRDLFAVLHGLQRLDALL